tara:strand:- start:306 stop:827 length:522 start_codon:yes stop_codon:yes gene_type:complete
MAFKLNGEYLQVDVQFSVGDVNYPKHWLRFASEEERKAIGITEVEDPKTYDKRFYNQDGTAKSIDDVTETINGVVHKFDGVKTVLKDQEKIAANNLLSKYDWQVVRKAEKGTAIDTAIATYRDGIRAAYETRKTEIDNCADTAALVTLYDVTTDSDGNQTQNMTQYPEDPNGL